MRDFALESAVPRYANALNYALGQTSIAGPDQAEGPGNPMHNLLEPAFTSKRVLVTGHTGFKGAWLSIWLGSLGARITGYALAPPTNPSVYEAAGVSQLLESEYRADVRDAASVTRAVNEVKPDIVFHLAAQPLVLPGYETPVETFETNVMGTVHVLDAIRRARRPCVVIVVTSDKCYLNHEVARGYREDDALGGADPYSASKAAAEIVASAYARSFFEGGSIEQRGIRLATARAGNVIGGGDWAPHRLVPDIVRAFAAGEKLRVRNPTAIRPWQHVLEPVAGYLVLGAAMSNQSGSSVAGAWNFGPRSGEELPVRELVRRFREAFGHGTWEEVPDPNAPHEAGLLHLDIDKAVSRLPWTPRWTTEEAIARTARWYRGHCEGGEFSARDACQRDIDDYLSVGPRA